MGEKQKLIVKKIGYEGYFNYKEFFRVMDLWLREKHYDKEEKFNEQYVTPAGKHIDLEMVPWKKVTDYFNIKLKINVNVDNLRDVTIEVDGKKVKTQEGKISCKVTGYLIVDYETKWNSPLQYFYRFMMDNFIYRHITNKYRQMAIDDTNDLSTRLGSYLNITPYQVE